MTKTVKKLEPMTSGPIWKRISYFALPILLGNLFQQLYNTVDSLIVGNFLGSSALAAVSSLGSLIFMLVGFLGGVAVGAGVVIARYFGAGDIKSLRKAVHTTVAGGLLAAFILTVAGVLFTPQILKWMGTPDDVMPQAVLYIKIYFGGSVGLVMYNTFVGILQAVGDSRHPLYYLIASSVINLVLDVLFITVFHTGVDGAAAATVISQVISALLCLAQLLRSDDVYKLNLREIHLDRTIFLQILRLGLPSGMQNCVISFANVIVQANINSFGAMAMAGVGAYDKVEGFGFLPITSFALALTTFVGQNLGAEEYERTKRGAKFGIITTVVLAEIIGVIIFIFAPVFISAFDSTPEVVAFGTSKARVSTLFYCLLALSHAMAAVYRGAGKAAVPMFVMLAFWCVIRITFLAIVVPLTGSIYAVYWVYPLTWFLSSVTFIIYYKKVNWMERKDI